MHQQCYEPVEYDKIMLDICYLWVMAFDGTNQKTPEANIEVRTIKRLTALSLEIAFEVESHLTNLTCPLAPGGRLRPWFLLLRSCFNFCLRWVVSFLVVGMTHWQVQARACHSPCLQGSSKLQ